MSKKSYYFINEYKGVKVVRKEDKKGKTRNASYNRFLKRITLYKNFLLLDEIKQHAILEHEYAHHVWHKMPALYQKLWIYISNGKLLKILNILGITPHKENAYCTSYAKTKETEDFAESIEVWYILKNKYKNKKRFGTYADFKIKVAKSMVDYFSKK